MLPFPAHARIDGSLCFHDTSMWLKGHKKLHNNYRRPRKPSVSMQDPLPHRHVSFALPPTARIDQRHNPSMRFPPGSLPLPPVLQLQQGIDMLCAEPGMAWTLSYRLPLSSLRRTHPATPRLIVLACVLQQPMRSFSSRLLYAESGHDVMGFVGALAVVWIGNGIHRSKMRFIFRAG